MTGWALLPPPFTSCFYIPRSVSSKASASLASWRALFVYLGSFSRTLMHCSVLISFPCRISLISSAKSESAKMSLSFSSCCLCNYSVPSFTLLGLLSCSGLPWLWRGCIRNSSTSSACLSFFFEVGTKPIVQPRLPPGD